MVKGKMTIENCIKRALRFRKVGSNVSKIRLTRAVTCYRGLLTLDASVSKIIRNMDKKPGFGYEVVKDGVFRITEKGW